MTEKEAKELLQQAIELYEQRDLDNAIEILRKIQHEYSPKQYARAQFILGLSLGKKGDSKGEVSAYRNIKREYSLEWYAKAQVNIGFVLAEQGNIDDAIKTYDGIERGYNTSAYAMAQFNLGTTLLEKKIDEEGAITAWKKIDSKDLGWLYEYNYYEIESVLRIIKYPFPIIKLLLKIRQPVAELIRNLWVKEDIQNDKKLTVAHYTDPNATYNIIAKDSPLRLTSVQGVNDPSEGSVLYQYMKNYHEQKSNTRMLVLGVDKPNQTSSVFISCFTFNHDSLNQFRLYGKEEGREASGISLVLNQRFFNDEDLFGIMAANINTSIPLEKQDKSNTQLRNKSLGKLPLYRCLYIDPRSGYLSIAQRDKTTFFAESWHDNKTADYKTICEQAEKDWCSYRRKISKLTSVIKDEFTQLAEAVAEILNKSPGNDVLDTLAFILQPLRYLVKHAAFQEEQECRMLYITSLDDARIKSEWDNKRMYLEYATPVKEALDKIYLSPGAQPHEYFFKKELSALAKAGKIRHSQNPFRNK